MTKIRKTRKASQREITTINAKLKENFTERQRAILRNTILRDAMLDQEDRFEYENGVRIRRINTGARLSSYARDGDYNEALRVAVQNYYFDRAQNYKDLR